MLSDKNIIHLTFAVLENLSHKAHTTGSVNPGFTKTNHMQHQHFNKSGFNKRHHENAATIRSRNTKS